MHRCMMYDVWSIYMTEVIDIGRTTSEHECPSATCPKWPETHYKYIVMWLGCQDYLADEDCCWKNRSSQRLYQPIPWFSVTGRRMQPGHNIEYRFAISFVKLFLADMYSMQLSYGVYTCLRMNIWITVLVFFKIEFAFAVKDETVSGTCSFGIITV